MEVTTQRLILDVMDSSPGALVVIAAVLRRSLWYPLRSHLKTEGLVGSALRRVIKDAYGRDTLRFSTEEVTKIIEQNWELLRGTEH